MRISKILFCSQIRFIQQYETEYSANKYPFLIFPKYSYTTMKNSM